MSFILCFATFLLFNCFRLENVLYHKTMKILEIKKKYVRLKISTYVENETKTLTKSILETTSSLHNGCHKQLSRLFSFSKGLQNCCHWSWFLEIASKARFSEFTIYLANCIVLLKHFGRTMEYFFRYQL